MQHLALTGAERHKLTRPIVNDPHRALEAQFARTATNGHGIVRIRARTTHYRVDRHVEPGVLREPPQLLIQDLEALLSAEEEAQVTNALAGEPR
jgi:hypothetical protein